MELLRFFIFGFIVVLAKGNDLTEANIRNVECKMNENFQICARCEDKCVNFTIVHLCQEKCITGCLCKSNFVRIAGICVESKNCKLSPGQILLNELGYTAKPTKKSETDQLWPTKEINKDDNFDDDLIDKFSDEIYVKAIKNHKLKNRLKYRAEEQYQNQQTGPDGEKTEEALDGSAEQSSEKEHIDASKNISRPFLTTTTWQPFIPNRRTTVFQQQGGGGWNQFQTTTKWPRRTTRIPNRRPCKCESSEEDYPEYSEAQRPYPTRPTISNRPAYPQVYWGYPVYPVASFNQPRPQYSPSFGYYPGYQCNQKICNQPQMINRPYPNVPNCPNNEMYLTCGSKCPITCGNLLNSANRQCGPECASGCFCIPGYYRNSFGICIVADECFKFNLNINS